MKRLGVVLIAAAIALCAMGLPAQATSKGLTLAFSDDFNGTSLNASKWNNGWFGDGVNPTHGVSGAEDDCYDPKQVSEGGGYLTLTAVKRTCLGKAWASGLVNTNGKFSFATGVFKARVCFDGFTPNHVVSKTATDIKDWPGGWTDGQSWPKNGEIDLVEGLGGSGEWHVHDSTGVQGPGTGAIGPGCHIVKYVRTASKTTFFYDKVNEGSANTSSFAGAGHYLVFNLAVSNSTSPPEQPAQYRIDWVQVWT